MWTSILLLLLLYIVIMSEQGPGLSLLTARRWACIDWLANDTQDLILLITVHVDRTRDAVFLRLFYRHLLDLKQV